MFLNKVRDTSNKLIKGFFFMINLIQGCNINIKNILQLNKKANISP
jgi:hypothetical protein